MNSSDRFGLLVCVDLSRDLDKLLPLIIDGLSGRTWQGKEHVVELLAAVTTSSKDYFSGKKEKQQEIAKVKLFPILKTKAHR
jgi:proteasome component ECM29